MKKESKRIKELRKVTMLSSCPYMEAVKLVKEMANAKFNESIEAHICLNIDPKYANQQLRTTLSLPYGTGNNLRIAVFTEKENVKEALELGASVAGFDDLLEKISLGILDFDVLITNPALMNNLTKLGKILGPKSLMPSQKSGTVTSDLKSTINEFKKGKVEYRADKTGIVHLSFGKANFEEQELCKNLEAVYLSIEKNKPNGVKGKYFKSFHICSTMSPSIEIQLTSFH